MIEVDSPAAAVQLLMSIALILMGLSHIAQPGLWRGFFRYLHSLGSKGVMIRTFALELWPALLIVVFHQVWHGPGVVLTVYGWLLFLKVSLSLLVPDLGLRSLKMADGVSDRAWAAAGLALIAVGSSSAWPLVRG